LWSLPGPGEENIIGQLTKGYDHLVAGGPRILEHEKTSTQRGYVKWKRGEIGKKRSESGKETASRGGRWLAGSGGKSDESKNIRSGFKQAD